MIVRRRSTGPASEGTASAVARLASMSAWTSRPDDFLLREGLREQGLDFERVERLQLQR
jgi:hypothetical protein